MALPEVNQPFSTTGLFWKPGDEDNRVPGRLHRTEDGIRIQLFTDLRPGPTYEPLDLDNPTAGYEEIPSPHQDEPLTLRGRVLDGGSITACDCTTVHTTENWSDPVVAQYVLEPRHILFGGHTTGIDQDFTGVRIRTTDTDEWTHLSGFSHGTTDDGTRHISLHLGKTDTVPLAEGAELTLSQAARLTGPTVSGGVRATPSPSPTRQQASPTGRSR